MLAKQSRDKKEQESILRDALQVSFVVWLNHELTVKVILSASNKPSPLQTMNLF